MAARQVVFVGDAGMNSEDNRRKLALGNGKYILASRMRAGDEVTNFSGALPLIHPPAPD